MRKLLFSEILLISQREKRARKIKFHPTATLIAGRNDTGKSSLVKSLFQSFGAEPPMHPRWKSALVSTLVRFSLDGTSYSILHYGGYFSLFDEGNRLIRSFKSVSSELGPYLSDLLSFGLRLPDRDKQLAIPPPAYYFLPYYVDQDRSWTENWNAFTKLSQFSGEWKKQLAEYHTGIRPNEYYKLAMEKVLVTDVLQKAESELKVQSNVLKKFDDRFKVADFTIDIDAFKEEVEELLFNCEKLKEREQELKDTLTKLNNIKIHLDIQIRLVENARTEIGKDFQYADSELLEEAECPTCGAVYENSFAERFSIAQDENRCLELLSELHIQRDDIDKKIEKTKFEFNESAIELTRITEILERKKSDISLNEIIESEGKRGIRQILKNEIRIQQTNMLSNESRLETLKKKLAAFNKEEKRAEILNKYHDYMRSFLYKLEVHNLAKESYKNIHATIKESGSDLPRALLAYYYSILHIVREYSTSAFCPIVIDSPNQQDQDIDSLYKMVSFILNNRPANSQLILCAANIGKVPEFDGEVIELQDKDYLLSEKDFEAVADEMKPFIDQSLLL